jgi:hypothetical protein
MDKELKYQKLDLASMLGSSRWKSEAYFSNKSPRFVTSPFKIATQQLFFIDSRVVDYQMPSVLCHYQNLNSIQTSSHGSQDVLHFGNSIPSQNKAQ